MHQPGGRLDKDDDFSIKLEFSIMINWIMFNEQMIKRGSKNTSESYHFLIGRFVEKFQKIVLNTFVSFDGYLEGILLM